MRNIIVGSRQSALALTQTNQTIQLLKELCERDNLPFTFEVKPIVTRGDRILDVTLSKVGGKGLFVKEIEEALLNGQIDMAIHSMKDMPFELPEGLVIGAIPRREDPRDCIVSRGGKPLAELPQGARIGTSSLRRSAQLQAYRPDFKIESIRGNIDTRLRKLEEEGFDAILLAAAGLHRMGWKDRITEYLSPEICLPAVGQGALAIECRGGDGELLDLLGRLNDQATARAVEAERRLLGLLNGGCQVPIGAYARLETDNADGDLTLEGLVASPDGRRLLRESASGPDPLQVGSHAAEALLSRGAGSLLAEARE
ncbi:hydroxymethylbilane synthase [Cohnella sp. CIP 111063]|jgi:hydroxymethylbilane synthase|uniref:hydroxymethylbilane synthase n=1 Tax=unclassified Cohnella TaxID=2636738 RepID=UPI000B8C65C0|nr:MULTISPECIES: hydroxymethylbilane synthase [unclassified Cohnella]OXS57925.1 hydroxymethylbilane synthase [Cohnella sp. CIP 111063]PRX71250.1 hydroxymethylbilane synthase [Cohnella sp. SGD-V74]